MNLPAKLWNLPLYRQNPRKRFSNSWCLGNRLPRSFHKAKALDYLDNIIPIFQPPHSPKLNPIERFWEFLKSKLQD